MNTQGLDWSTIAGVVGLLVGIIALLRDVFDVKLQWSSSRSSIKRFFGSRWSVALLTLALVVAAALLGFSVGTRASAADTGSNPQATINAPNDGAEIGRVLNANGTYNNIPSNRELWLYHQDTFTKRYYLDPAETNSGLWQVENIAIGDDHTEDQLKYQLGFISVSREDGARLRIEHDNLPALPASTQTLAEIVFFRR